MDKRLIGFSKKTGLPTLAAQLWSNDKIGGKTKRNKYTTKIEMFSNGGKWRSPKVKLSCSCSDFMYRWEVALNMQGSADIVYSNGEDPGTANPSHDPGCCKHLIYLYQSLSDKELKALMSKASK